MAEEYTKLESLSDFWRKRQSDRLDEELANVLDGARGYVGFFGSDFTVDWGESSTADLSKKRVELDFSDLKGKTPPFDGKDVDIVMGTALHECGHIKWSYPPENVKEYYAKKKGYRVFSGRRRRYGSYPQYLSPEEEQEAKELQTIANIIEDFYVENKISEKYPTLGAYLREARKLASKSELPHNLLYDLTTDKPSFDSLVAMWGAIALIDKTIPDNASNLSKRLLNKLINETIKSAKATPQKRLQTSYRIWDTLKALDRASKREQERQDKQTQAQAGEGEENEPEKEETGETPEERETEEKPKSEEKETDTDTESKTEGEDKLPEEETEDLDEPYQSHDELRDCYSINLNNKESMPQDLKDTVDAYLERKPEDITQQVNQMLGGAGGREIVMELAGSDPSIVNKHFRETRKIAQKISKLFMYDKRLRTRYRRGLQEGAVDTRRLYRAGAMDYKLFERKEVLTAPSLAVGILVDASGSMGFNYDYTGARLEPALKMAMALKTALSIIEGVDLMVMAYNSADDFASSRNTTLYRISDRRTGEFRPNVKADGGTPSGYALSGMVSQIGKYLIGKDKLIIHITDGCPNNYEDVSEAVDYCKKHKIDVMTLTLFRFDKEVTEAYRGLAEHLDSIDKLPDAVASLLKTRLQKRMMRIK